MVNKILLNNGLYATIDDDDYDLVKDHNWCCALGYAITSGGTKKNPISMHRLINKTPKGMSTDHINGDRLDNRKSNLRTCTHAENRRNNKIQTNNTSGYTGVSWHKRSRNWRAYIKHRGRVISLGYYKVKEDAAKAYNEAAQKYFGDFARLNIIGGKTW